MKKLLQKIKDNKSFIMPWVVLGISILIFASGLTYAYFDFVIDSEEQSSLKVIGADFEVVFTGSNALSASGLMPINDINKETDAQQYNFTYANNSSRVSVCYSFTMKINSISEGLKTTDFKWELYNRTTEEVEAVGNFANIANNEIPILDNATLTAGTTYSYVLRIWLSNSLTQNQANTQNTSFYGSITTKAVAGACANSVANFEYTGSAQTFTAPSNGVYKVELWGAEGGSGHTNGVTNNNAGKGGYTSGILYLAKGETLYVYVGGQGGDATTLTCENTEVDTDTDTGGLGGYNGGGTGGDDSCTASNSANDAGGGGGGATDVRLIQGNNNISLNSRIMVAGGGGGSTYYNNTTFNIVAGAGGGLRGISGQKHASETDTNVGTGGTQISGNSFGIGANGIFTTINNTGDGGGGGGYYGAVGHTTTSEYVTTGGGGSSFISGHTGCVAIVSESDTSGIRTPRTGTAGATCATGTTDKLCSIHYSNRKFVETKMIDGTGHRWTNNRINALGTNYMPNPSGGYYASGVGHTGDGYAKITLMNWASIANTDLTDTLMNLEINLDGGQVSEDLNGVHEVNEPIILPIPSKTGYNFVGWTGSNGTIPQLNVTIPAGTSGNRSYIANWTPITYTIAYNCNGGTGSTTSSTHVYSIANNLNTSGCGQKPDETNNMVYSFSGWSTSNDSTIEYTPGQQVSNLTTIGGSTVTLYAVYSTSVFNYSSSYTVVNDSSTCTGCWKVKFLTNGNLTVNQTVNVDAFLVGGGGGGTNAGGGGGYTNTSTSIVTLSPNESYPIVIGLGGEGGHRSGALPLPTDGESSIAFGYTANGGKCGGVGNSEDTRHGGDGGSGGGAKPGNGGSDGLDGDDGQWQAFGGTGQGTTTREFGDPNGTIYSGGGGSAPVDGVGGLGGEGGGGDGSPNATGENGMVNTGGGGGGGAGAWSSGTADGGDGGSGIVIIRNAR